MSYTIKNLCELPKDFIIDENLKGIEYSIGNNIEIPLILENIFKYKKSYLFFYNNDVLEALFFGSIINNKFVSHPHLSYGGILISEKFKLENYKISKLFDQIEIRSFEKITKLNSKDKVCSILKLDSEPLKQLSSFKYNIRRQIRVSSEKGVVIKSGNLNLLEDFYNVYSKSMHKLGSPPQPKYFFKKFLENWVNGEAMIFCAYYNEKPVASSFALSYSNVLESCWAGSLNEYNKYFTMYLLYWEMIKKSIEKKYRFFSFGRSSPESGSLRFKNHWKPQTMELYRNQLYFNKGSIKDLKFINNILRSSPIFINNLLGKIFTKYIY